jgi:5-(carboxyamino)imidazole ribonucleotide synthase
MSDYHPQRIGLLGGGQLARMLAEQALRLGLTPVVFADSANAPAAQVCREIHVGSLEDYEALSRFFDDVDVVAFENEFVDTELLADAAAEAEMSFVPSLDAIATLQDKLKQKRLLQHAAIATAPFVAQEDGEADAAFVTRAFAAFPAGVVFKWSRMGYDGHGVLLCGSDDDRSRCPHFFERGRERGAAIFAEQRIEFVRELAMVSVASAGAHIDYPLVISEQEHGICRYVYGPATSFGVNARLEAQAREACRGVARAAALAGAFALEFFETASGDLLVNEIAPRVHNSGHYSQNACSASQFENHVRAAAGMTMAAIHTAPAFAMLNILGPEGVDCSSETIEPPRPSPGTHVHWYGKNRLRARRKLGHVNVVVDDPSALPAAVAEMHAVDEAWIASVRRVAAGGNE